MSVRCSDREADRALNEIGLSKAVPGVTGIAFGLRLRQQYGVGPFGWKQIMSIRMDAVWIRTVSVLEMDLSEYVRLRKAAALERDTERREALNARAKGLRTSLNRRYAQFLAFAAGLPEADIEFDCDLQAPALVIDSGQRRSFVFGPSAVASSYPYLSPEFTEFVERAREADDAAEGALRAHDLSEWLLLKYGAVPETRSAGRLLSESVRDRLDAFQRFIRGRNPNPDKLSLTLLETDSNSDGDGLEVDPERCVCLNWLCFLPEARTAQRVLPKSAARAVDMVYIK